jgi:hypothetical protein
VCLVGGGNRSLRRLTLGDPIRTAARWIQERLRGFGGVSPGTAEQEYGCSGSGSCSGSCSAAGGLSFSLPLGLLRLPSSDEVTEQRWSKGDFSAATAPSFPSSGRSDGGITDEVTQQARCCSAGGATVNTGSLVVEKLTFFFFLVCGRGNLATPSTTTESSALTRGKAIFITRMVI